MTGIYSTEPDFEAEIVILTADQGGRINPPQNYIRWDFGYAEDHPTELTRDLSSTIYSIYPNFLNDDDTPIPKGLQLYGKQRANMHIWARSMVEYHRSRISVGTKFYCHEGKRIVATGTVTKLIAILE